MSGITLTAAESALARWLDAEAAVAEGKSFTIGDRNLTNHDLSDILAQIDYWDRRVKRLSRGASISAQRVIVHD